MARRAAVSTDADENTAETVKKDKKGAAVVAIDRPSTIRLQEIDPDLIAVSPELDDLRDRATPEYQDELLNLAQSIFEMGQTHPGKIRLTPDGYVLIAGQRRLEAVKFLRSPEGVMGLGLAPDEAEDAAKLLYRAEIEEDINDADALRVALQENILHRHFTHIEIARNIKHLRERFENMARENGGGTKDVADFLGVSTATVTEHERLLNLPAEVQADLQNDKISMATALELAGVAAVAPDKLADVHKLARSKAADDKAKRQAEKDEKERQRIEADRAKSAAKLQKKIDAHDAKEQKKVDAAKKKGKVYEAREYGNPPTRNKPAGTGAGKPAVSSQPVSARLPAAPKPDFERQHVRAAVKELGVTGTIRTPRLPDVWTLVETWCGPGQPDAVVTFFGKMLDWAKGGKTDKWLTAALDDLADLLPAGKTGTKTKTKTKAASKAKAKAKPAPKAKTVKKAAKKGGKK